MKRHPRRNWQAAAACLLSIALLVCLSAQYLSFVSKTIYAESTQHLGEVLHKSNNMLSMIVKKNTSYLHVWNGFLSSDPDDASTQAYLESAQQQLGFADWAALAAAPGPLILHATASHLPEAARTVADRMRTYDWLTSYQRVEAVGAAIDRMSVYRLRRANSLAGGIEEFFADPEGFAADFREFLPDALSFAQDWRARR